MNIKPEPLPRQGQSPVEKTTFLLTEVGFLSALGVWGGPAWVGIIVPGILVEIYSGSKMCSLGMLMPAGLWLLLCRFTGNREFFFPYAMYVTAFVVSRLWEKSPAAASAAGFFCGGLFLSIRWYQDASTSVLMTEGAVAVGIVFAMVVFCWQGLNRGWIQYLGLIAASLLAYAGLAL